MKTYALALCAILALGSGVAASAQGQAPEAASAAGALGNAPGTDESTLAIEPEGDAEVQAAADAPAGPDTTAYFLRMILVLALVLAAMYLVFRLLRRAARPSLREDASIQVLASRGLGPGKALHLVGLGGKAWLIGATDQGISLIAPVEDKELLDALLLKASTEAPAPRGDFASLLSGLLSGQRRGAEPSGRPLGADYLSRQRERLKKYREPGR